MVAEERYQKEEEAVPEADGLDERESANSTGAARRDPSLRIEYQKEHRSSNVYCLVRMKNCYKRAVNAVQQHTHFEWRRKRTSRTYNKKTVSAVIITKKEKVVEKRMAKGTFGERDKRRKEILAHQ